MSVAGPSQSNSIYAKLTPSIAAQRLYDAVKKHLNNTGETPNCVWILRESSLSGCLTLSYFRDNKCYHMRFGLIAEKDGSMKWENLSNLSHNEIKDQYLDTKKLVFMNMSTSQKNKNQEICKILFEGLENEGFRASDYLNPSKQEQTRNSEYVNISITDYIDSKLNDCDDNQLDDSDELLSRAGELILELQDQRESQKCPITLEHPGDTAAILLDTPHLYGSEVLKKWVEQKGTDPQSRREVSSNDILKTNIPERIQQAIELLEEKIERKKRKM